MPPKTISYTVSQTPEVARQIDSMAAQNGFAARSTYIVHAALNYGRADDHAIVAKLAHISYALHRIDRAASGQLHFLKPRDVADISRLARAALTCVIARNAG